MPRSSAPGIADLNPAARSDLPAPAMRALSILGGLRTALALDQNRAWPPSPEPSGQSSRTWRRTRIAFVLLSIIATAIMACPGAALADGEIEEALALCYPNSGNAKHVSSAAELKDALSAASPGDHIVVAAGTYSGNFSLSRNGTASDPIVIRAASSSNRPHFSGRFLLEGDYAVLEGFTFTGKGRIEIRGNFNRATRNLVDAFRRTAVYINKGATNNRVDHNEIRGMRIVNRAGVYGIQINTADGTADNRIDHNYLHDFPDQGRNGHEPIRLAVYHPDRLSKTLIDHNLLVRTISEGETIGIKGNGNRIIGNTVIDGRYASNRQGRQNVWKNNWFENTDLRVYGKGNEILGNHLVGGAIHLLRGSTTQNEMDHALRSDGSHAENEPVAEDTLVAGNSGGSIQVGLKYRQSMLPRNTRLEGNMSKVVKQDGAVTYESTQTSIDYGTARKLTTSDVGLNAPDPSCQ